MGSSLASITRSSRSRLVDSRAMSCACSSLRAERRLGLRDSTSWASGVAATRERA